MVLMLTYHVNEYGFRIYLDGELIATFKVSDFPQLIAQLAKVYAGHRLPLTTAPRQQ